MTSINSYLSVRLLYHFSHLFSTPFFFVYCGAKFVLRKALTFGGTRVTIQTTKNTSDAARAAFGVFCLTTVYPIYTTGVHGNSGDKSAGKDVFPSGNGRKRPEISGKRYSEILWEQDVAGSNPVIPTKNSPESFDSGEFFFIYYGVTLDRIADNIFLKRK